MKRYLVFGFDDYYAIGGPNDLLGETDELPDLKAAQAFADPPSELYLYDNYAVLDTETGKVTDL